ncbi:MAG TPA: rhomboid family intramembrane serine protease [Terriglobales bacterium]|jgi:hypothetical protein
MIPLRDDTPRFSTPYITYFIIALNSLIFVYEAMLGFQSPRALNALVFEFGVVPTNIKAVLTGGTDLSPTVALVPILTSMFLHGSLGHVAGNMLFLWIFGDNIEDYLGHFKYLLFYLVGGVTAAVVHILFNPSSMVPTVGASGAIAAVMGAYLILYPRGRVLIWFPIFFFFYLPAWLMLGYWFVVQFLSGAAMSIAPTTQTGGGIAVWAHVGGFVAGVVMIKLIPPRPRRFSRG